MTETFSLLSSYSAADALQTSWEFLLKGGVFMIPLALTSIIGMTAILYKFLSLSRSRVIPDGLADKVARFQDIVAADKIEPVLKEFENGDSTLARLAAVAVKHRGKPQRDIILAVEASAREETSRLHAGIGVLDIVITVAPLLGLLGTASGLVTIFQGSERLRRPPRHRARHRQGAQHHHLRPRHRRALRGRPRLFHPPHRGAHRKA